jgi:hypothetical protein
LDEIKRRGKRWIKIKGEITFDEMNREEKMLK